VARVSRAFGELDAHLQELTDRVIREAIDEDVSEPSEVEPPKALGAAGGDTSRDQATNSAEPDAGNDGRSAT
jgi:hypothetical protein